jgi:transcriptional regulator with XRE-family HTH domain
MTLALRLRRLLDARGYTAGKAARAAGIDRQMVYRITSGTNDNPRVKTLEAIVTAIGGTLGELFADEG